MIPAMRCFRRFSFFAFLFPEVNKALRRLANYLNQTHTTMPIDSEKTVELLDMVLETLKTSKQDRENAQAQLAEAIAALEPLRAENSRINTTLDLLNAQAEKYQAEDAAEDAALQKIVDYLNPPPVEDPPVEDPPTDPPVEDPPVEDPPNEEPAEDPTPVDPPETDPDNNL